MYTITENLNSVEIENISYGVYAKIHLKDGASLQKLTLNNIELIKDLAPLSYKTTYASAILFPFANRVEDGKYSHNKNQFQLNANNKEENNALHGLVYNRTFSIKNKSVDNDKAELVLKLDYNQLEDGFPFPFSILLKYTFSKNKLNLEVTVENKSESSFPFTIGWHPYFLSDNLNKSVLNFESHLKLNHGERNIGINLEDITPIKNLNLKDKSLDDCWQLESQDLVFETPKYKLQISSSEANSFLQVYTPPKKNTIAIEPTTGVSNSFNNKIGLKILEPNEVYDITWSLKVDTY